MDDFQKLTDFGNLYNSCQVSLKGKGKKSSAAKFSIMALENLYVIKQQLLNHRYKISPYNSFIVSEPKKRVIKSGSFRDKVLQHCLCDYVLLPKMKDIFIKDNYAGQIGKGTLYGLDRLSENLSDYYQKHGLNGYILKCDITKFFYSINHDAMKKELGKYFTDEDIRWICGLFIDSVDGDGLPLGNQSSQVFALIYLTGLDYFITEELGCKYYGRYMDDFYLLSDDKDYLKDCLLKIKEFLAELHLTLNSKTEIVPISKGVRFLGFHTYITNDGKIIRKLTGDNKRKIKKRLCKYSKLVIDGRMTRAKFDEIYASWRNHASHGNCHKLIHDMDLYVCGLFGEIKPLKHIIISGSKKYCDYQRLKSSLDKYIKLNPGYSYTIIAGNSKGAEQFAEKYARERNIEFRLFPIRWDLYSTRASYVHNIEMLDFATEDNCNSELFLFGKPEGKPLLDLISKAKERNIKIIHFS